MLLLVLTFSRRLEFLNVCIYLQRLPTGPSITRDNLLDACSLPPPVKGQTTRENHEGEDTAVDLQSHKLTLHHKRKRGPKKRVKEKWIVNHNFRGVKGSHYLEEVKNNQKKAIRNVAKEKLKSFNGFSSSECKTPHPFVKKARKARKSPTNVETGRHKTPEDLKSLFLKLKTDPEKGIRKAYRMVGEEKRRVLTLPEMMSYSDKINPTPPGEINPFNIVDYPVVISQASRQLFSDYDKFENFYLPQIASVNPHLPPILIFQLVKHKHLELFGN